MNIFTILNMTLNVNYLNQYRSHMIKTYIHMHAYVSFSFITSTFPKSLAHYIIYDILPFFKKKMYDILQFKKLIGKNSTFGEVHHSMSS